MREELLLIDVSKIKDEDFETYLKLLSKDNRERVLKFQNKEDQLLCLGARLLEKKYIEEKIEYNEFGKPTTDLIHYNLSHCYPYVCMYLNDSCEVGVDIQIEKELEEKMIEYCFNPDELKVKQPIELWTLKEAYLKCLGTGIIQKLNELHMEFNNDIVSINCYDNVFYKTFNLTNYCVSIVSNEQISVTTINKLKISEIL